MAEPICEDEGLLQEWSPLTQLLQIIPLKIQKGLFSQNLNLTCLDVISEYIALGTNSNLVYWYSRINGELQKLQLENSHSEVTCVKVVSTVDYMVAAGTNQGTIIVFQITKLLPESVPDHLKQGKRQIERFTINGLHNAPVTSIEWSQNGMKLFSGDKKGLVVLTEMDFSMHLSKSIKLINEQYEIVQLSYNQQLLLISTLYRSIICNGANNWKVHQVGTKERKILGKFGATLCKFNHDLVLYACRPGHRLWVADKMGVVQQTLLFKSAVCSDCPKIQVINPVNKKQPVDLNFGKILQFCDKLITYNSEILFVLHPGSVSVTSVLCNVRKILDLAVNENEIFILEGSRSLLRISPTPDNYSLELDQNSKSRRLLSFGLDELATKIKDRTIGSLKKLTMDLIPVPEQISPDSYLTVADDALELPPIVYLPNGSVPSIFCDEIKIESPQDNLNWCDVPLGHKFLNRQEDNKLFNKGSNFSFNKDSHADDIISRPLRKKRNKLLKNKLSMSQSVLEWESDTTSNTSDDRLMSGLANDLSLSDESAMSQSNSSFSVLRDISLVTDKVALKDKELVVREIMTLSDCKSQISVDSCESVSECLMTNSERFREEQDKTFARLANQSLLDSFNSDEMNDMSISVITGNSSTERSKHNCSPSEDSDNAPSQATESQTSYDQKTLPVKPTHQCDKTGDENLIEELSETTTKWCINPVIKNCQDSGNFNNKTRSDSKSEVEHLRSESPEIGDTLRISSDEVKENRSLGKGLRFKISDYSNHWSEHKAPEPVMSLFLSKDYAIFVDINDRVYYSKTSGLGLSWVLLDCNASDVRISQDGSVVWLMNKKNILSFVSSSSKYPVLNSMQEMASNVLSFAIDCTNNDGWLVTSTGKLMHYPYEKNGRFKKPEEIWCPYLATDVACSNGLIIVLTVKKLLLCKTPEEGEFRIIKTNQLAISSFSLAPNKLLWIRDENNLIYFSDDFLSHNPNWWQIQISDYIFRDPNHTFQNIYSKIKVNKLMGTDSAKEKPSLIATNENSVWICEKYSTSIRINKSNFTGYIWNRVLFQKSLAPINWITLSGEGVFENKGHIWLLATNGHIFCTSPIINKFQTIPVPCEDDVLCIASSSDTLWVLSESGSLYSRLGLGDNNLTGSSWRELKLPQIDNLRLVWVSCGCDVAWGCDIHGRTFMTIGSPHHMATNIFDAAWLEVEERPKGVKFVKVFVGPHMYMVWAIDHKGKVYVREGIFSYYQIGTGWVYVGGIEAVHVSISSTSVWALAPNGTIYRRCGISESNYIGDFWQMVPGVFKVISSSFTDDLWGITSGNEIMKLSYHVKILNGTKREEVEKKYLSNEGNGWEIIN